MGDRLKGSYEKPTLGGDSTQRLHPWSSLHSWQVAQLIALVSSATVITQVTSGEGLVTPKLEKLPVPCELDLLLGLKSFLLPPGGCVSVQKKQLHNSS